MIKKVSKGVPQVDAMGWMEVTGAIEKKPLDIQIEPAIPTIEVVPAGWLSLGDDAFLRISDPDAPLIDVVGVSDAGMLGANVLWVGG